MFRTIFFLLLVLLCAEPSEAKSYTYNLDAYFGKVYLSPELGVSRTDPFYTKVISVPAACSYTEDCRSTNVRYSTPDSVVPLDGNAPTYNNVYSLFQVGNTGLAVGYRILDTTLHPQTRQEIEFGLFKISNKTQSGVININLSVLQIEYYRRTLAGEYNPIYNIHAKAQVNAGSCIIDSKNLSFILPPLQVNDLNKLPVNSRIEQGHITKSILAQCSGVEGISLSFYSGNTSDNPEILNSNLDSGVNSGVGFMLFYNNESGTETPVKWGANNIINIKNPSTVSIPITAYYTKTSNDIKPGNISANGTFVINYQ